IQTRVELSRSKWGTLLARRRCPRPRRSTARGRHCG
ncbi:hypothetical protein BAE44_0015968, partial [Dichanthelium oligosanthes]